MAHFVLAPAGSHGDVHPYIALGRALTSRGHTVVVNTSEHFGKLIRESGLEFLAVGTEEDFQAAMNDPNLWNSRRALRVLFDAERFPRGLRQSYEQIAHEARKPETVVVGGTLSLSARLVHEKLGVPMASLHLQPMSYTSISDPPMLDGFRPKAWWPRWYIRTAFWVADRMLIDPVISPPVNAFRRELGLPLIKRIWGPWRHSPQCILSLYPEWFGPARDLPPQLHRVGFIRYDQSETMALPPAVEAFLNDGPPPVVVSFGSAMMTGRKYFEAAVEACAALGQRALILARGGAQIPPLPPGMLHADYAPFSLVFPRAAVTMHHGGIGTCAQAMAAGVRQFIMPLAFDQFDNVHRLEQLGVARSVPAKKFTAERATAALKDLLADAEAPARCADLKARMADDPMPRIVAILESQVRKL